MPLQGPTTAPGLSPLLPRNIVRARRGVPPRARTERPRTFAAVIVRGSHDYTDKLTGWKAGRAV